MAWRRETVGKEGREGVREGRREGKEEGENERVVDREVRGEGEEGSKK